MTCDVCNHRDCAGCITVHVHVHVHVHVAVSWLYHIACTCVVCVTVVFCRHAHLAHNQSTNALVAHVHDGVEVIHIYSGEVDTQPLFAGQAAAQESLQQGEAQTIVEGC
jgi:hypothetical protein